MRYPFDKSHNAYTRFVVFASTTSSICRLQQSRRDQDDTNIKQQSNHVFAVKKLLLKLIILNSLFEIPEKNILHNLYLQVTDTSNDMDIFGTFVCGLSSPKYSLYLKQFRQMNYVVYQCKYMFMHHFKSNKAIAATK